LVDVIVAGAINWDINLFVRKFPQPGGETPVLRITRVAGGKAGNVAVAAARLLGPHRVAIIGALGKDDIGKEQNRLLSEEGVDTSTITLKPDVESGQAYIIIEESGENEIHTYFGANAILTPDDILSDRPRKSLQSARIVTISDPPEETIEAIVRIAHAVGTMIAWDPGVRSEAGMERLRPILARTNYLFLNEVEVEYMTGTKDQLEAAKHLSKISPHLALVMKSGSEGCTMFRDGNTTRVPGVDLQKHRLRVVNTVGCGDAFLGAFSAAKAMELSDEEALDWANWAGALKATKPETRGGPTLQELRRWMKKRSTS
jgi:ribokinase